MDIHKPKAAHSLREFAIEIGTIICGILIALGLEQAVEWLHWRHEVTESRKAIRAELAHDLGALEFRAGESDCVKRRLADLGSWEQSWKAGKPLRLSGPLSGPASWSFYTETWAVAQGGQVAPHFPVEELNAYAQFYGQVRAVERYREEERQDWLALLDFEDAARLDSRDLMRLHGLRQQLLQFDGVVGVNVSLMRVRAAALGIRAERLKVLSPERSAAFCRSLIVPASTPSQPGLAGRSADAAYRVEQTRNSRSA